MRISVFSCSTMGFGGDVGPAIPLDPGTGPTTIGMRTDAGMAVNGVAAAPAIGGGSDACGGDTADAVMPERGEATGGDTE